jgi:2-keto-4-pentenoate hydratase/2-oxohepta-3-ene-1,7-dioic acid hydratase in catechol pathway
MRIIRYLDSKGAPHFASEQSDGKALRIEGDIYATFVVTSEAADVAQLLAPIVPAQILCIGLNYKKHAEETGAKLPERPVLFVKGINALQHPGKPILLPRHLRSDEVDYECELAVVIRRSCKNVSREHALKYVLGYTCANDVSARDHQIKLGGGQWCRGKFFDTFAPLGPRLITSDELNPGNLRIRTELNGETVQDSRTSDMAFDVPAIIEYLSGSTTLVPGTVILTGTPSGVGMAAKPTPRWLRAGDEVTIDIEGIGRLTNPVEEEQNP